jgi:hypothetical protein
MTTQQRGLDLKNPPGQKEVPDTGIQLGSLPQDKQGTGGLPIILAGLCHAGFNGTASASF